MKMYQQTPSFRFNTQEIFTLIIFTRTRIKFSKESICLMFSVTSWTDGQEYH